MIRILFSICIALFSTIVSATTVRFDTTLGELDIELYADKAPKTVKNFLAYVKDGSYNNTLFHRVIKGFVAQGGGYDLFRKEKPENPSVANESDNGLSNSYGTIAMARSQAPNSATRQFYLNLANNSYLDGQKGKPGYTVFGKVVQGLSVLKKLNAVKTHVDSELGTPDMPVPEVVLRSVAVLEP